MSLSDYKLYKQVWIWEKNPKSEFKLSKEECLQLLSKGGLFVRNFYDFDTPCETSFWYVIKDSFNGFKDIPSKYRGSVRTALDLFDYSLADKQFILKNGYPIYLKASQNYKVKLTPLTEDEFIDYIHTNDNSYEFWSCVEKTTGQLAAFAVNHIIGDYVEYQIMKFDPDFLRQMHVSYGLIYEMNRYYLEEKQMSFVNDGARSLTNHSEMQPFLIDKFKFRRAFCRGNIYYKSWLRTAVSLLYPFRKIITNKKITSILLLESFVRSDCK